MRVQIIARPSPVMTGTARYVDQLQRGLSAAGVEVHLQPPRPFPPEALAGPVRRLGPDLQAFFASYPLRVRPDAADVYHIPAQTMATLLTTQRFPGPVIVTVLDIIPYLVQHDPALNTFGHAADRLFYRLALGALKRADAVIAISEFTKKTLVEALALPPEKIHVTHLGVDHQQFRPLAVPEDFRARYGLAPDCRYVLYIGSEDPRKNLRTLIRSFVWVKEAIGSVKLLKVGRAHFAAERQHLQALVAELNLQDDVRFIDAVPEAELPLFYNVADVLVLPSLYEGFGLPVLEAMACGRPVVISNRTSLPELVGGLAPMVEPTDMSALAEAICAQLDGTETRLPATAWREQALRFDWTRTIEGTLKVYEAVKGA